MGCTAAVSGTDARRPPDPDAGNPMPVDAVAPGPDTGVDRPSPADGNGADMPGDAQTESRGDAQSDVQADTRADASTGDAPRTWPPPGTDYLTKLESQADYDKLSSTTNNHGVAFIIRRRANDVAYPHPWDSYECVFETGYLHVEFLQKMDPARAVTLYFGDAKSEPGSLIPGRLMLDETQNPKVMKVTIENYQGGFMSAPSYFPLDATVRRLLRERIMRCVPFAGNFTFFMFCPTGNSVDCPLPP
jgi:hypothetical protein